MWQMLFATVADGIANCDCVKFTYMADVTAMHFIGRTMRTIKDALYIKANDPSLNRNVGKYHLPHVWMRFCLTPQHSN